MQMKDDAARANWKGEREALPGDSADPEEKAYFSAILEFAEAWADEMEKRMVDSKTVADVYKDAAREVDRRPQFGITGNMYGGAVLCLSRYWLHGEALRIAHNTEYGRPDAPPGAVVNPAVITISVPDGRAKAS